MEGARRQACANVLPGKRRGSAREMLRAAKINDYETLLTTNVGLKATAIWLMSSDLLSQYSLARDQL